MSNFIPQITADGSYTFFSAEFQESFHSSSGAYQEAQKKFIEPCRIAQLAKKQQSLNILDICYGLGYNSATALQTIWTVNPHCQVHLIALERDPTVPEQALAHQLLNFCRLPVLELLTNLVENQEVKTHQLQAQLLIGDARYTLKQVVQSDFRADAIFLDPFSPTKCPQLWTVEFLSLVAQCLTPTGRIATYSCAAPVRTALKLAGLNIGSTTAVGRRSPGTLASFSSLDDYSLSQQEQEQLNTRAGIPYRDPPLQEMAEIIKQRRKTEQENSNLETSSQWKKRWRVSCQ